MKTAIQQLIDDLTSEIEDRKSVPATNKMYHTSTRIVQEILDFYVKPLLEKEKEQIIEAYGRAICMFYESEQPEEYYNETFNNIHISTDGKVGLSNPNETTNNKLKIN
jgi:hypothetical protein